MAKKKSLPVAITVNQRILGYMYLIVSLFLLPIILNSLNALLPKPLSAPWLNLVYYGLNFVSLVSIFRGFLLRSFQYAFNHIWLVLGLTLLGYFAYSVLSFGTLYCIRLFVPGFSNVNDANIAGQLSGNFWVVAIGTALLVPTAEELLHRALVFGSLHREHVVGAYIVSMLLFAVIHVMGYVGVYSPVTLLLCFVQYLPAGLVLAFCYEKSGCILVPIMIHTIVNTVGLIALR